jgi:transposase InsO family protein
MSERTTTHAQRVAIVERHQAGESLTQIAQSLSLNRYTVRGGWRRYRDGGWAALRPYQAQGRARLARFDPLVRYGALRLKCEHPGWGVDQVRLALCRRPSLAGMALPKRSSLAAYLAPFLRRIQPQRRLPTQRPQPLVAPTQAVHQRWQMDFKGEIKLPPIGVVQPWVVCDEPCGAPLAATLDTAVSGKPTKGLTCCDVQQALRQVFSQWGLPHQVRMDRDGLWIGSPRLAWPGTLRLWLAGLGIEPIINRPGRPTDNAVVERMNRTWLNQVAVGTTAQTAAELQRISDGVWHDRRTALPSHHRHCQGRIPAQAFPERFAPRRPFACDQERTLFSLSLVHRYLAQWQWQRKVDLTGCISLADQNCAVSRRRCHWWRGQIVSVHFDPSTAHFVVRAVDETPLAALVLPPSLPTTSLACLRRHPNRGDDFVDIAEGVALLDITTRSAPTVYSRI